ncbi:organomercurial lyase [Streptomyces sp. XY413]|uniref:organomercurial lyase n=1 Tax=Streptomyces sp. XY413 TaxID=1519479 RepID=UPI000A53D0C1|nr:organomercurial lyase [Streptomyces sp. XY413]
MTGSPTLLLDGIDPFAVAGAPASVSCRLYRDADGAPSIRALRQALAGINPAPTADGLEFCEAELLDPIGRAGCGRKAPAERGLRAGHQAVLRYFATHGTAPDPTALEPVAARAGRTAADVLAELDREDFLTLDEAGRVRAAYPFSAVETRHRMRLASGVEVWSMCAVDALGVSAVLGGQDVRISSSAPVNGKPVTVTFTGGTTLWQPADAVVSSAAATATGPPPQCAATRWSSSPAEHRPSSGSRRTARSGGQVVSQDRAVQIGQQTFGPLLQDS